MRQRSLRVMTYNVRGLRDNTAALATVLRACEPDVVALQEPPIGPAGRRRLRRVAATVGLVVAVCGGGARSTAVLVRSGLPVTLARAYRLPWQRKALRGYAVVDVAGLRVVSIHLGLWAAQRQLHLLRIIPVVLSARAGCVVAGDLNEQPTGPVWRGIRQHMHDLAADAGPTFPAREATMRIDAVLGTVGLVGGDAYVVRSEAARAASDHLPVVVDVRRV